MKVAWILAYVLICSTATFAQSLKITPEKPTVTDSIFIEYARRIQEREIDGFVILVLALGLVYSIFRYKKEILQSILTTIIS